MSPFCERAIDDALTYGRAILKFISANDVGLTGGHQYGFYLPKKIWNVFTPNPPEKGINSNHPVTVLWQDGSETGSVVKWYGKGTRSEYRLTRFGKDFAWRTTDNLGDLLVLIPKSENQFIAYVLDLDEDIEEIQAALGIEVLESWNYYEKGIDQPESEDVCLNRRFREFSELVDVFPEVRVFSETTIASIKDCVSGFGKLSSDEQLLRLMREEYNLFLMVERKIFQPEVQRLFKSIDDFIETALRILNARKSRAGRSFENHVEYLFREAGIPFQMRVVVDQTRPDIIIPNKIAYDDPAFPTHRLFMVGVKTTCKDRWRQVTKEAPRIEQKHILTLQKGVSSNQLDEMHQSNVSLIVPEELHKDYPRGTKIKIFSVHEFVQVVREVYRASL